VEVPVLAVEVPPIVDVPVPDMVVDVDSLNTVAKQRARSREQATNRSILN
jgi:hypothetical protein